MTDAMYDKGLAIRKKVAGENYVNKVISSADDFNRPFDELVTSYCWGAVWGRDGLSLKTRSLLNIVMLTVLNRPAQLKTHVSGALRNGCTEVEIREALMQAGVYGGVPAAQEAFRVAREAIVEWTAENE